MARILDLQRLELADLNFVSEMDEEFESTSSWIQCACSICSVVGCKSTGAAGGMFVAI